MKFNGTLVPVIVLTITLAAIWQITGGDYYTKFEVVKQVEKKIDPNDPLAAAGFIAPWMAALGMSLSSLIIVINATRITTEDYS